MAVTKRSSAPKSAEEETQTEAPSLSELLVAAAEADRLEEEEVKVNNASITEMKHACDDALKRFLSRPELFKQIYTHTDVRLALGWASVFVAAGTGLYGYKVDFEESKHVVWFGVILYVTLTICQTLYAYFVEKDTVFVGRRKVFDKRIISERITISSKSIEAPSPVPEDSFANQTKIFTPPQYSLFIKFIRDTSNGKTLLGSNRTFANKGYNEFFDVNGKMDVVKFEKWLGNVVAALMEGRWYYEG